MATSMYEKLVDLSGLSEGDLMDLVVASESANRRILVMWLYLKFKPQTGLDEFDRLLTNLAEKELQRRAGAR